MIERLDAGSNQPPTDTHRPTDTLSVCVLTAGARGAIATVAVHGPGAQRAVATHFRSAIARQTPIDFHVRFGHWFHGASAPPNDPADTDATNADAVSNDAGHGDSRLPLGESVVVCKGEGDSIEIHCHGGRAAVDSLVADLIACGANKVDAQRWLEVCGVGALESECRLTLAKTQTATAAAIVIDQMRGAMQREIESVIAQLENGNENMARGIITTLLVRYQQFGRRLVEPFRITIAGPPNVGKSSLINRLLGYQRAITTDQPGTTRDVLAATTAIDGWMFELSDTAGIRDAIDAIESEGVRRAEERIRTADLVLIVVDASLGIQPQHKTIAQLAQRALWVMNKVDLLSDEAREALDRTTLAISTTEPSGIDTLARCLGDCVLPEKPEPSMAVPLTIRCRDLLQQALDAQDAKSAIARLRQIAEQHPQVAPVTVF